MLRQEKPNEHIIAIGEAQTVWGLLGVAFLDPDFGR